MTFLDASEGFCQKTPGAGIESPATVCRNQLVFDIKSVDVAGKNVLT